MPVQLLKHILYCEPSPDYCRIAPGPDVRSVVAEFFLYSYPQVGTTELAMSDGMPVMFFMSGRGVVQFAGEAGAAQRGPGYLSGPILERTYIDIPADVEHLLGVRFTSQGLYHLLGPSVGRLRDRHSWSLRELWGADADVLSEGVAAASSLAEKIGLIEKFVRRKMRECEGNPLFAEAVESIRQSRGQASIEELCRTLHLNYKWLERQFGLYLGIAPKEYARLQRFLHAFFEVQHTTMDLIDVAVRNGYYDQSHFAREFRRFTGKAPMEYMRGMEAGDWRRKENAEEYLTQRREGAKRKN